MPLTPAALFRLVVAMAMALHIFWMYALARTINGSVGFHLGVTIVAALFALVMTIPLVWAIGLLELPDMIGRHRAQRRFHAGRCPGCGYPAEAIDTCPECASRIDEPTPYRFTAAAVHRFIIMVVIAWAVGIVAGESWLIHDEQLFRHEVRLRQSRGFDEPHDRRRRWPVQESRLFYEPAEGVRGEE